MALYTRLANHRVLAIVVAGLVVVGGAAGAWSLATAHHSGGGSLVVDDGPSFYGALEPVNSSVAGQTGGPWMLSQVFGIASPVPTSPSVWGWGPYDDTLNDCQAAFNGLTIWNGTIPLFNGTFNSGTAPFWQFVFFSNATLQLLVATNVLGAVHLYPPIGMSSPCAVASSLGYEPWVSSTTFYSHPGFPGDTPAMAASAWDAIGKSYVEWLGAVPTEMYLMGALQFGSGQPLPGIQTMFFTCGVAGWAGATPGLDVFGDTYGTNTVGGWFNYTLGCTPTFNNWTAAPVEMEFSNSTIATETGTTYLNQRFVLASMYDPLVGPPVWGPWNARGITSWMIGLNLSDAGGQRLQVSGTGCASWVPSLSLCPSNSSGWYAVLLSGNGSWLGSFGASASGNGWTSPVIPFAANQTLVVIVPSDWSVSGDSLEVSSTTGELPLTGSCVFS